MRIFDSGKEQNKLLSRIERQEKQQAFRRDRFFRFKLEQIHNRLSQGLLMDNIIETDQPTAVSDLILKGLKQILRSSEFDFKYFISPIRDLVPRPNPYALYMTQYVKEVMIKEPSVLEIYGTDQDIYSAINGVISQLSLRFERDEEEVKLKLANMRDLKPGTRDYDVALDQALREKLGEPARA